MKTFVLAAPLVMLALAGCSPDSDSPFGDNVEQNQQEFQNTATDVAGPRELSPPRNRTNE